MRVPGAFEIPLAAQHAAESGRFDAIVCLGCLIRGETPHFEFIASAVAHGLTDRGGRDRRADGVRRADDQLGRGGAGARRRRPGNKGWEAAVAAIEMAEVVAQLTRQAAPRAVPA